MKSDSAASGDGSPTQATSRPLRLREELQHGRGDDAERAFGADEQVLEVVAGVVLLQLAEIVEHLAGRQHDLERRGRARAHCHRRARRCRRHWTTDCRRSGTSPAMPSDSGNSRSAASAAPCSVCSTTPASAVIGVGQRVDLADAVQPGQRQHDLVAGLIRHLRRRPGRCCRPAARSASPSRSRASGCGSPPRRCPASAPAASGPEKARAISRT